MSRLLEAVDRIGLSIAIINFKAKALLEKCIQSILASGIGPPYEMVVIDNDSKDGSVELVAERFPDARVIANSENVGFARAVNMAFSECRGPFVLVLNPDIEVSPGAVNGLLHCIESDPKIALVSPKLLNPDGSLQYSCRTHYSLPIAVMRRTILGTLFPNHRIIRDHLMMDWDHAETREVEWVLGAAMMLRREAFVGNQVMDERFFLYFEDVDLCLRLRAEGWKVVYHPPAIMTHHYRRSSAKGFWRRERVEHVKSWLKFEWKHRERCLPWLHIPPGAGGR